MLRVIAGDARRVQLDVPEGIEVRPTLDKIKGAIFSALGDLTGAKVLDLCSGSGSLGLEALSRGAQEVVMVEQVPKFANFIKANLVKVLHAIDSSKDRNSGDYTAQVVVGDAAEIPRLLSARSGEFDVILADPPYVPKSDQKGPMDILSSTSIASFVSPNAILMLESGPELFAGLELDQ
ncbi:MAG: RsmD family RNA methyltransferase, partial [Lentisphaeria bacterium]|nr:RsmD family RNA methyltransferase [Lentisphaeria bacterium]